MKPYHELMEEKYHGIAKIPEFLFSFTVTIRKKAIEHLNLLPGSSVLDVGCGTGASFPYLEKVIGESGDIVGVEPSRSMIAGARKRIQDNEWDNIALYENTIEAIEISQQFDGALLFAMHDVFNSLAGLHKIHSLLKPEARIVCVGPRTQTAGPMRIFNPMLTRLFKRMALSQDNQDQPWRLVETIFKTEKIIHEMRGLIFVYVGRK